MSIPIRTLAGLLLAGIFLGAFFFPVLAQTPPPVTDDQVNTVARELYCPVCENIPLDVCPTPACTEWRELIRAKLAEGWNKDQIKEYFAQQYGDRVLAEPPRRGFNWLAYSLPPLVFVVAASLLYRSLRPRGGSHATQPLQQNIDSAYLERMEEELKKQKD